MPRPRKYQKRIPRGKRVYKKRRGGQRMVNVNRALRPFAQRFITKMKYSESYVLTALNAYTQICRLNGLQDPNQTGIGHQPYGFDQLAAIYNRYRVIATSYVINAYNGTNPIRVGCLPTNDASAVSGISELCENPRAKFILQYPQGNTKILKGKVYLPSLAGRSKSQYMADDRYQSDISTNPVESLSLYITGATMTDANVDITLTITMEYTVEWFDAKAIDQS